jgi:hypothetical protein
MALSLTGLAPPSTPQDVATGVDCMPVPLTVSSHIPIWVAHRAVGS